MAFDQRLLGVRRIGGMTIGGDTATGPSGSGSAAPSTSLAAPSPAPSLPSGVPLTAPPTFDQSNTGGDAPGGQAGTLDTGEATGQAASDFANAALTGAAMGLIGPAALAIMGAPVPASSFLTGSFMGGVRGAAREGLSGLLGSAYESVIGPSENQAGWQGLTTIDAPASNMEFAGVPGLAQSTGPGSEGGWSSVGTGFGFGGPAGGAGFSEGGQSGLGSGAGTSGSGFDVGGYDAGGFGGGGGDGGGGGGCVICTTLYGHGLVDPIIFKAITDYGHRVDPRTLRGYHLWGKPVARFLSRSPLARRLLRAMGRPIARELAFRSGVGKSGWLGRALLGLGIISSLAINSLIASSEGKSCMNCKSDLGSSNSGRGGRNADRCGRRSKGRFMPAENMSTTLAATPLGPRFRPSSTETMATKLSI